ncbi:metal ABC transporter solute-binding protein, Zn/Mn family [Virgibacillus sp. MG-45]|uniref:metal ABC transporter solute-binding protein, Zn/Mn family n=1 Tax=Virgibacillus sp. MG-45 TaxID=3102791 RepID=UPI002ED9C2AF
MKFSYGLFSILFILLVITGCSANDKSANQDDELTIYTSIYPIQYIVERLGEETVNVQSVYPPGVDAHTYEPTSKDIAAIAKGDAFIYLGAGLEGFAETAADALAQENVTSIELGAHEELFHTTMDKEEEHTEEDHGHDHGDHDPHIWLDPIRMKEMSAIVADALITLNPQEEEMYATNLQALNKDLEVLDEQYSKVLTNKQQKKLLVAHKAFGYWEERYGIEQIAISGISSSEEPSQKDLVRIVEQAEKYQLDYIIFEQNTSNRVSEIIQTQIGAKALTIHNLAVLTELDTEQNADYFSLMEKNLKTLDEALQ